MKIFQTIKTVKRRIYYLVLN